MPAPRGYVWRRLYPDDVELFGYPILNIAIAVTIGYFFWRTGFRILRGMAAPISRAAAAGRAAQGQDHVPMRYLRHRGSHDGGARSEPPPPRHCLEDMDLVAPIDD